MRFKFQLRSSLIQPLHARVMCLLLFVLFAAVANVVAVPLSSYRERVHKCVIDLDSLKTLGEDMDEVSREEFIATKLAEVRRLLPPRETIDSTGPSLEIDNLWLHETITEITELSYQTERRNDLLTQTVERLSALEVALVEREKKTVNAAGTPTHDEAKSQLANILRREEFVPKSADGNALTRLWKRFRAWLRSLFPRGPQLDPGKASFLSQLAQIVVVVLALAIIGFVVWKMWPRIWKSNPKSRKGAKGESRIVLGEHLEPGQTSADLLAEAEVLARDGNLRGAIRKGYIALLCELGDRKVLGLAGHKTNRDYLYSLRGREGLFQEMQFLTLSFENHWYGFVPAEMEDWNVFRTRYHQALRSG